MNKSYTTLTYSTTSVNSHVQEIPVKSLSPSMFVICLAAILAITLLTPVISCAQALKPTPAIHQQPRPTLTPTVTPTPTITPTVTPSITPPFPTPTPTAPTSPPVVPEASTLFLLSSATTGLAAYAYLQVRARRRP